MGATINAIKLGCHSSLACISVQTIFSHICFFLTVPRNNPQMLTCSHTCFSVQTIFSPISIFLTVPRNNKPPKCLHFHLHAFLYKQSFHLYPSSLQLREIINPANALISRNWAGKYPLAIERSKPNSYLHASNPA